MMLAKVLGMTWMLSTQSFAAPLPLSSSKNADKKPSAQAAQKWMLGNFVDLASKNPQRLLSIAGGLFSAERLRMASADPVYAYEWQHRVALVSSLSMFFSPEASRNITAQHRKAARRWISQALLADPSLVVRDGAAESIRRIIHMQPGDAKSWQGVLEKAFLDKNNVLEGEGLFIRETLLTALREGSLHPSKKVRIAAQNDKNPNVPRLLNAWNRNNFDTQL